MYFSKFVSSSYWRIVSQFKIIDFLWTFHFLQFHFRINANNITNASSWKGEKVWILIINVKLQIQKPRYQSHTPIKLSEIRGNSLKTLILVQAPLVYDYLVSDTLEKLVIIYGFQHEIYLEGKIIETLKEYDVSGVTISTKLNAKRVAYKVEDLNQ